MNKLLTGIDAGNISTKVSFLNTKGNIESFAIPTVIAPAPASAVAYNNQVDKREDVQIEDYLHIRVNSSAMDKDDNNRAWYVGESANKSTDKMQPSIDENGDAEDKFSDKNREVFVLPVLAGIAVSALKSDKTHVVAPLSIGIPSKSYLKYEQTLKQRFIGKHLITFIDGQFTDQTVTIEIHEDDAQIHAESVTTAMALMYDIKDGDLMETELSQKLEGKTYTVADLGAGTSDYAVFTENELDKVMTRRFAEENEGELSRVGTNTYIEDIIEAIYNDPAFDRNRELVERSKEPEKVRPAELTSREIFMKKIIKPVVEEALLSGKKPNFEYTWARAKNVPITKYIVDEMEKYAEKQMNNIETAWITANTDCIIAVGGGVLFGYFGGLSKLQDDEVIIPDLLESQYFTSKAYLIVNFLMNMQSQDLVSQ
jgi:plasmid segregation protein ParM